MKDGEQLCCTLFIELYGLARLAPADPLVRSERAQVEHTSAVVMDQSKLAVDLGPMALDVLCGRCEGSDEGHRSTLIADGLGRSPISLRRSGEVPARPPRLADTLRGSRRLLVLPHPENRPARVCEQQISVPVPGHVLRQLPLPPLAVRPRIGPVLGAGMPEAAVYEDGQPDAGEGDVDGSPPVPRHGHLDPVPEPSTVQFSSKPHLGGVVASG